MSHRPRPTRDNPPVRALKVGEAMRHALAELFQRHAVHDEALADRILSVSEVDVTPDLRHATAWIVAIGASEEEQQAALQALRRHARYLQGEVARRVNTRYAAELHFQLDQSFTEGARIDALLRSPEVARDLEADLNADPAEGSEASTED